MIFGKVKEKNAAWNIHKFEIKRNLSLYGKYIHFVLRYGN